MAEELGLTIALEEAQEAYKRADILAKKKIPVLLRPSMLGASPYIGGEQVESRLDSFVLLSRAGVKTALPGQISLGEIKYDPTLSPLPPRARAVLDRVERDRAYSLSRLRLLDDGLS